MALIGNIFIDVSNEDLAKSTAECLVVPEFKEHFSEVGIGKAIYDAGMAYSMRQYGCIASRCPFQYGETFFNGAQDGNLLAHVAIIGAPKSKLFSIVFEAMLRILLYADKLEFCSIGVPELGTDGCEGLSPEQSLRTILGAVYYFTQIHPANNLRSLNLYTCQAHNGLLQSIMTDESYKTFSEFDVPALIQKMGYIS